MTAAACGDDDNDEGAAEETAEDTAAEDTAAEDTAAEDTAAEDTAASAEDTAASEPDESGEPVEIDWWHIQNLDPGLSNWQAMADAYMAEHPPLAPGNLAAVINIDCVNIIGPTRDVNVIGMGKSDLDDLVGGVARWQNRVATPDAFPDRGYYYRSDQFSLAKIGVPGVYLHSGVNVIGQPEGWGKKQLEQWTETRYHQPSDEYDESWDLRGAVQDLQLLFRVGHQLSMSSEYPNWFPGNEFRALRDASREVQSE